MQKNAPEVRNVGRKTVAEWLRAVGTKRKTFPQKNSKQNNTTPNPVFTQKHNTTMANTYTQIHVQTIFAVQNRQSLIQPQWAEKLNGYITGIIKNQGHKLLQIGGMPDHLHVFIGMRPHQALSDLMRIVKGESSKWINQQRLAKGRFSWQEGYGAFSYAKSQVPQVIRYIQNQEEYHRERTFIEEYKTLLKAFEVEYDERYIFKAVY